MPSLGANTTYGGGGSSIRTTGGTALYGGGGRGDRGGGGGWLENAARQRVNQGLYGGSLENQARQLQLTEARRAARQARAPRMETRSSQTGMDSQMRRDQMRQSSAQTRMLEAQANAMTGPAPTKMNFGFNIIPGRTLDPMAMSGAQRQMYLPQSSSFNGIPTPSDTFRNARAQGEGEQAAQMGGIQQMLQLMAGAQPGYAVPSGGSSAPTVGGPGAGGGGGAPQGEASEANSPQGWFQPGPWASPGTAPARRYQSRRADEYAWGPPAGGARPDSNAWGPR